MSPKSSLLLLSLLLLSSAAFARNITYFFQDKPDFSTFNDLLTRTKIAGDINKEHVVTVLALNNDAIGAITGKPDYVLTNILATHVILDYYDKNKLGDMKKNTIMTTLFQRSGVAYKEQGQLNATRDSQGKILFGSAMKNAERNAELVDVLAAKPYTFSVLQISQPIIAPGIDQSTPHTPPPNAAGPVAKAPAAAPPKKAQTPAHTPEADAPEPDAPSADAPAEEADSPASGPAPAADDDAAADADEKPKLKSAGTRTTVVATLTALASLLAAFVA